MGKNKSKDALKMPWYQRILLNLLIKKLEKSKGMKSWKTTILGIAVLLAALGTGVIAIFDGDPTTTFDLQAIMAALAGLGLTFARDNNVTSEKAGAK